MTEEEVNLTISKIIARALTEAREAGVSEEFIFIGFASAALDVAKREPFPAKYGLLLMQYAELLVHPTTEQN